MTWPALFLILEIHDPSQQMDKVQEVANMLGVSDMDTMNDAVYIIMAVMGAEMGTHSGDNEYFAPPTMEEIQWALDDAQTGIQLTAAAYEFLMTGFDMNNQTSVEELANMLNVPSSDMQYIVHQVHKAWLQPKFDALADALMDINIVLTWDALFAMMEVTDPTTQQDQINNIMQMLGVTDAAMAEQVFMTVMEVMGHGEDHGHNDMPSYEEVQGLLDGLNLGIQLTYDAYHFMFTAFDATNENSQW